MTRRRFRGASLRPKQGVTPCSARSRSRSVQPLLLPLHPSRPMPQPSDAVAAEVEAAALPARLEEAAGVLPLAASQAVTLPAMRALPAALPPREWPVAALPPREWSVAALRPRGWRGAALPPRGWPAATLLPETFVALTADASAGAFSPAPPSA